MAFDVDNFKFSPDLLKLSGGNFKAFLKQRYGKLKASERDAILDKYYGNDPGLPKKPKKADPKDVGSVGNGGGKKGAKADSGSEQGPA